MRHYDNDTDFVLVWFDFKGPKVLFPADQRIPERERERERETCVCGFVWRKVKEKENKKMRKK